MSSSQSRGSLGKGSWGLNLPSSRKAGQGVSTGLPDSGQGLPVLEGAQVSPAQYLTC